jgi:hypothetical protein
MARGDQRGRLPVCGAAELPGRPADRLRRRAFFCIRSNLIPAPDQRLTVKARAIFSRIFSTGGGRARRRRYPHFMPLPQRKRSGREGSFEYGFLGRLPAFPSWRTRHSPSVPKIS